MSKETMKLVANNKKAYHDYFVDEKIEAGLVLHGTEVKSLRMGKCSIKNPLSVLKMGKCSFMECTFLPTKRETFLTKTLYV